MIKTMFHPKTKISFKSYHGVPYKKYSIYRRKPRGSIRFMGNMIAPNDELALAKAKESFRAALKPGDTLFVSIRE